MASMLKYKRDSANPQLPLNNGMTDDSIEIVNLDLEEYWDVCDSDGVKLGYIKRSDEKFHEGEYHIGASLWIANFQGDLLIQKRASSKKVCPNVWSITGGKVRAGETSVIACLREVEEEIGLRLCEQNIRFLYRSVGADMLFDDYIAIVDFQIDKAVLNLSEVSEIKWASLEEIMYLYSINEFMYNNRSDFLTVQTYLKTHLIELE